MNVQFTSGAVGHLTGSYDASMMHPIERCEVGGSKGRGIIENVYERLEFMPRESKEKLVIENGIMGGMGSFDDTFKNRIYKFVEQVSAGEDLIASGEEGLKAQEVIEGRDSLTRKRHRRGSSHNRVTAKNAKGAKIIKGGADCSTLLRVLVVTCRCD
jgi:hypothetical protein